jgi:hypothetical protein
MRFARCPKCDHAPLPADQSMPASCPSCGLVFAKYANALTADDLRDRAKAAESIDEETGEPKVGLYDRAKAMVTYIPERVDPMHFWPRVAIFALLAAWSLSLISLGYKDEQFFSSWIHRPLLIFHEAGHVIFSIGGQFMAVAGGTLGQLLMPAIIAIALMLKNRDTFGGAVGVWFFGVSLLDVAPYVYDALKPQLILLGGHTGESGGHDFIYLLDTLGLLGKAQTLGSLTHKLGALVVIASLAWAGWVLWKQKRRLTANAYEE